ncbi:hypothetical protein [Vibrio phage VCPH]|nr:hypothetical protein [Vibrio phage VCPH]
MKPIYREVNKQEALRNMISGSVYHSGDGEAEYSWCPKVCKFLVHSGELPSAAVFDVATTTFFTMEWEAIGDAFRKKVNKADILAPSDEVADLYKESYEKELLELIEICVNLKEEYDL